MNRERTYTMKMAKNMVLPVMYCLLVLAGCTDSTDYQLEVGKSHTITLSINMPGDTEILSRALTEEDECRLDEVDLLLFDASGYIDRYPGESLTSGTGDNKHRKTFMVELPPGTYDILIVGNCRSSLAAADLQPGQSRQTVATNLKFTMNDDPWGYNDPMVPSFVPFPIYGEVLDVVADSDKTISDIPVVRMVARIDVKLSAMVSNEHGRIRSVRLYNANRQAQIIPAAGNYTPATMEIQTPSIPSPSLPNPDPLVYIVSEMAGLTEMVSRIYTPEAYRGTFSDYLQNTCLVVGIGGAPEGSTRAGNSNETYYYRVDFMDQQGDFIPLLRNSHYVVTVDRIINAGFPDPDKAFRSEPYGLDYTILEWETFKNNVDYDPGIYRLDVSETYLDMGSSGGDTYTFIQVTTTHPAGWSAYFSAYPDRIDITNVYWLNDSDLHTGELDNSGWYGHIGLPAEKTLNLHITVGNPGAGLHTGYLHIVSGNMTNVITLKKTGAGGN